MTNALVLSRLRTALRGRWIVVVFAVPAILIGLLAMHVLTTGGMHEAAIISPASASASASGAHHADPAPTSSDMVIAAIRTPGHVGDCGGACMPSHDMLNMVCVLALLATVIVFALRQLLNGWPTFGSVLSTLQRKALALAPPVPPSLHVLSISRT